MREILFRGKDDESGEWVYGYLTINRDTRGDPPYKIKPCIDFESNGLIHSSYVKPESISQYTGLKDMNGRKVFEGDFLHIKNDDEDFITDVGSITGNVFYVEDNDGEYKEIGTAFDYWLDNDYEVEVIDNVFDKTELVLKSELKESD